MNINELTNLQIYNLNKIQCVILDVTTPKYIYEHWNYLFDVLDKNMINYYFYSNNSSTSKENLTQRLKYKGISCPNNNFLSVSDFAISYILDNFSDKTINIIGTSEFKSDFDGYDIKICDKDGDIVLVSDDTSFEYEKIKNACEDVKKGAKLFGTNPNKVSYYNGFSPACGSICRLITEATDSDVTYLGLPSKDAFDYIFEKTGYSGDEVCFISNDSEIFKGINNSFIIDSNTKNGFESLKDFAHSIDSIKNSFI